MSQSKRNNILFYSVLLFVIAASIGGTIYAIDKHNKNIDNNKVIDKKKEEIKPYLTFDEVSQSSTIDVFKKYPINPIKINHENNNKITISGLKDKEIEAKINKQLSILNDEKDSNGASTCRVDFNMSNILAIHCEGIPLTLNLVTGEKLKLEEIFNQSSDLYSILVESSYKTQCSWLGCYPEDAYDFEYESYVENVVAENLQNIKNNAYKLNLSDSTITLLYSNNLYDEPDETVIEFYDYVDEITIYNRYLDADIYENEVTDYCTPNNCYTKLNYSSGDYYDGDGFFEEEYFLKDRTFLNITLNNANNIDPFYNYYSKERTEIDYKDYLKVLQEEILNKENIKLNNTDYTNLNIYIDIYYHTSDDYQIVYSIQKNDYDREEFIKHRLGFSEAKTIKEQRIDKVNMLMDKNKKITYLDDDPKKEFKNFETKLYDYILESLANDNNDFTGYNICDIAEDYEKCEREKDFHDLIDEANYAIDKVNNRLHIYEVKPGFAMAESYVNTSVSLDIFKDTEDNLLN